MEVAGLVLIILVIIIFALGIFIIYFIFKSLQFVIQAINLYKKMVIRQDATIKILLDIRDNTKHYENVIQESEAKTWQPVEELNYNEKEVETLKKAFSRYSTDKLEKMLAKGNYTEVALFAMNQILKERS